MIDRIRHDLQERLREVLAEAEKLRQAIAALGTSDGSGPTRASRSTSATTKSRSGRRTSKASARLATTESSDQPNAAPAKRQSRSRSTTSPTRGARTARGATKSAVLAALAGGEAMTAGDIATSSGLGRATVSTTLSKLAKTGEVVKVERGYRLPAARGSTVDSAN